MGKTLSMGSDISSPPTIGETTTINDQNIVYCDAHTAGGIPNEALSMSAGNGTGEQVMLRGDERSVLQTQIASPVDWHSSAEFLFNCATTFDLTIIVLSAIAALVGGAADPFATLLLGNMGQSFRGYFTGETTPEEFNHDVGQLSLFYTYVAAAEFISVYAATVGFTMAGERIAQRIREKYLAAILRQNIAYFDNLAIGEVNNRLTVDINLVQDAITAKASATLSAVSTFIAALIISFAKGRMLTVVVFPAQVLIVATMSLGATFMTKYTAKSLSSYASGASIAEEAFNSIRTVSAFGMQQRLVRQFESYIAAARSSGVQSGIALAWMIALMNGVIFWSYGLAFWQGARFIDGGGVTLSAILTIVFANITGAFALGNISPHAQAFVNGITATEKISRACCRQSPIDPSLSTGERLDSVKGAIEFRHVRHIYPSRQEALVLDGFSHFFPSGKMTAIVGSSGCGKSTIVGLLQRFYNPVSGSIYLDSVDISTLNVSWLRQQIGIVGQEPALFSTTIFENIRYGLIGTPYENADPRTVETLVEDAARVADAYDFIMSLPDGFSTNAGDFGSLLSGGEKQRVAIARAIIGDPRILILDEATSALDTNAERRVQMALQRAARGRTTIAIAHRLSTISRADNIIFMSKGRIVEQGSHKDLMMRDSMYSEMIRQQNVQDESEENIQNDFPSQTSGLSDEPSVRQSHQLRRNVGDKRTIATKPERPTLSRSVWSLARFVYNLNSQDSFLILAGLGFSVIAGASQPIHSVLLAKLIAALSLNTPEDGDTRAVVNFWCLMYIAVGFTTVIGWLGQGVCFAYYSQQLTYHARIQSLDAILRHDIGAFFGNDHSTAALTSLLSSSAASLQGLSGAVLGMILVGFTTLVLGFVLALFIGWKFALICVCMAPVQIGCGILRLSCHARLERHARQVYESSAAYACEYSTSIRTVAALTLERKIQKDYHDLLENQRKSSLMSVGNSSLLYAASQSLNFLCASLAFWYGSRLVVSEGYTMFQFFVCYTAVIAGSFSAGAIFSFVPDIGKARHSAERMRAMLLRPVDIDARYEGGVSFDTDGVIELQDISFSYPNQPDRSVLNGINMRIHPGQYIALVGASGSGKSTIISLLERFFDPQAGQILYNATDIREWNVKMYRSRMALVSQSPALFDGTIRHNILLGLEDGKPSEDAIIQACKNANIYDFICSLPDGFQTIVGAGGALLSGGQKQRITIARALLRNPKILLLDEATSALDSESERVVQESLDVAAQGRTTIAVAHRISTVERADRIYVIESGRIMEEGTHRDLMEVKGRYYELVKLQSLS